MRLRGSLKRKLMLLVMCTTLAALLMSTGTLLLYELRTYRSAWLDDLRTHADLIALASAPALAFDDARVAQENLALLRLRPQVEAAALYRADGQLFATYTAAGRPTREFPRTPGLQEVASGAHVELSRPVRQPQGEAAGTVYLRARYSLAGRLADYLAILAGVLLASLALAAMVFNRLQHAVTGPILAVARTAQQVVQRRDFGLRVPNSTDDEVGVLVDAFNNMVQEVGRRTEALERSNRDLSVQMDERHKAELALRVADRRKDEFLATLAHELRNPLAPIANALELLKLADADANAEVEADTNAGAETDASSNAKAQAQAKPQADAALRAQARSIMERQLRQMVRLIDDLLEVSRITTGKLELRREVLDVMPVLRSALEAVEPARAEKDHHLAVRVPEGSLWVHGDGTRLAQVFANLLHNAIKYTDPGGRIELEVEPAATTVAIKVTDNGIGIARDMQEAVFEMFTQVDRSLERGRAGLGVGLTLARQLVELHGGTIRVFSAGLGLGSRFTVTLPLSVQPDSSADPVPPPPAAPSGAPLRVLLADDNVDFSSSMACLLEAEGHQVQLVHDGQAAYDSASRQPPDIAFLDIGMPRINGYELARRLRAQAATRHIVLVAITGWGQDNDRATAREAGFDHHLVKPVDLDDLRGLLPGRMPSAPPPPAPAQ